MTHNRSSSADSGLRRKIMDRSLSIADLVRVLGDAGAWPQPQRSCPGRAAKPLPDPPVLSEWC